MDFTQFAELAARQLANLKPAGLVLVSIRQVLSPRPYGLPPHAAEQYACALSHWPEAEAGAYGALTCAGPTYHDTPQAAIAELAEVLRRAQLPYTIVGEAYIVPNPHYQENPNEADRAGDAAVAYAKEEEAYQW